MSESKNRFASRGIPSDARVDFTMDSLSHYFTRCFHCGVRATCVNGFTGEPTCDQHLSIHNRAPKLKAAGANRSLMHLN